MSETKSCEELLEESLLLNKALDFSISDLFKEYDNLKHQSLVILTAITLKFGGKIEVESDFLELAQLSLDSLKLINEANKVTLELK